MSALNFVDYSKSEHVQRALSQLCSNLGQVGIQASWFGRVEHAPRDATLLLHDPVDEQRIPEGCRALGQRTLNRRERLVLAERCGLCVPRWRSLTDQDDVAPLFDEWGVDNILYKADWSYSRAGIRLKTRNKWTPVIRFNPDADVYMQILDGSPYTYKVDVFFDQIIACRKLLTRSVFDRKFYRGFTGVSSLAEIPPIEEKLKSLGRAVFDYGVGLTGVDLMFDRDGKAWVIELNTCSVGRAATWRRWPQAYMTGYTRGVRRWVDEGCPAQYGGDIESGLQMLSAREAGDHVAQRAQ